MIPYGKQSIDETDIQAVLEVLRSDWLTQGPKIHEFEQAIANYCGAKYAVACSSGTAALHLACMAANVKAGDDVVTSPITFLASANCARYVGASTLFCDIDPETRNIDLKKLEAIPSVSAVLPVHFGGLPCDMVALHKLAQSHRLQIIEDACHAFGARYQDQSGKWHRVGSCSHSDMAVFSFHPVKTITTGEGGMITTNRSDLYERLCLLRNHGMDRNPGRLTIREMAFTGGEPNPWYYELQELGYNYRISDMQAALGLSQLKRADSFVRRRREIADQYERGLKGLPFLRLPFEPPGYESAYHLYPIEIEYARLGIVRKDLMKILAGKGIATQIHYIPVHLQPFYGGMRRKGEFPNAERYYEKTLSIPIYPSMTDQQVESVIGSLKEILH